MLTPLALNMAPCVASLDLPDHRASNAKILGDAHITFTQGGSATDFKNLRLIQLSQGVFAAALQFFRLRTRGIGIPSRQQLGVKTGAISISRCRVIAAFSDAIQAVIQMCPKTEMRWVTAWPIVTGMHDKNGRFMRPFSRKNNAIMQLISQFMSPHSLAMPSHHAVSAAVRAGTPWPTFIGFSNIDTRPKILRRVSIVSDSHAS